MNHSKATHGQTHLCTVLTFHLLLFGFDLVFPPTPKVLHGAQQDEQPLVHATSWDSALISAADTCAVQSGTWLRLGCGL